MKQRLVIGLLCVCFAAACGVAWFVVFVYTGVRVPVAQPVTRARPSVAWRVQLGARTERPCACEDGWVVADAAGYVTKVTLSGTVQWRVSFSNEVFDGAATSVSGKVAVAAESGHVFCLDGVQGGTLWKRDTEARFQHAPVSGLRDAEPVLWLVSQEDGRVFCLRMTDGAVVWKSDATNRCDGEPVAWPGRIAYGNCDGAVYVFDSFDGKPKGKVDVGADDQMAGGILALGDGRLVTGTRQGRLVVVNPETLLCEAGASVSESEAFVTPVMFKGLVAMGSEEGAVTFWLCGKKELKPAGRLITGAAVKGLATSKERLFVLSGGTLCSVVSPEGTVERLALGDNVGGLAVNAAGDLAVVADGALVVVKGGE